MVAFLICWSHSAQRVLLSWVRQGRFLYSTFRLAMYGRIALSSSICSSRMAPKNGRRFPVTRLRIGSIFFSCCSLKARDFGARSARVFPCLMSLRPSSYSFRFRSNSVLAPSFVSATMVRMNFPPSML